MITFKCCSFSELKLEELYAILKLRQEVFVIEQDCIFLDTDDKDQTAYHLIGFTPQNELVAYARLIPKGIVHQEYLSIGRVVIASSSRKKGAGKALMQNAIHSLDKLFGQIPIKISAQCYLIKFYEALGFQIVGTSYLEDDIPHIGMIYKWDKVE